MKKVITYGTYDLFHQGHYNLLKRAKALGDYLIVGVTTDSFDLERGKMNTCNNVMERIEAVKSTGLADQIVIEEYRGQKIDDIQKYGVDIFAIGSDWEGYFDYLNEFCKVIYLPRTQGISSTLLRQKYPIVNIGIIGTGSIASRFVPESKNVNSASAAQSTENHPKNQFSRFARLACVKHAASVHPEPGSNSLIKCARLEIHVLAQANFTRSSCKLRLRDLFQVQNQHTS